MAITSIFCHVAGTNVTRIVDLEGRVVRLICPEYDDATGLCRIRQRASSGGPLSQLLERLDEAALDHRDARCELR